MSATSRAGARRPDMLAALKSTGSAEEVFALLGVGYDPKVVGVARLHILKRFGDYLAREALDDAPEEVVCARCKGALERAYADFVTTSPLEQRVFKVLQQAAAPPEPDSDSDPFVPLDTLIK